MLTDGPVYQQARERAQTTGKTCYVNVWGERADEKYLAVDGFRGSRCCAIAHPRGEIEIVVQDPFARVNHG